MTKPATRELPKDLRAGARARRDLPGAEVRTVDVEARTVELAFSSEAPVERWWGVEILDHSPRAARLDRLRRGGPLCVDHDTRDHVGVIEDVRIDADRVGRAVVRFGRSARATEILQDVADGIRRNVSVGYRIHEAVLERQGDDGDTYRVTDWEPYEISLVAAPADIDVGVGRSQDASDGAAPPAADPPNGSPPIETETETPSEPTRSIKAMQTEKPVEQIDDTKRREQIRDISRQFAHLGADQLAIDALTRGDSVETFQAAILARAAQAPKPTADIGMSRDDVQRFSLARAIRALANPKDIAAQNAARFEFECSQAAASKMGKHARGIIVPYDVFKRDLNVGTATAGGNLVATNLLAGDFIALLRDQMVITSLGARMITGLVGNVAIPRQTGGATAYWTPESTAGTESQPAFDQVEMSPKTVTGYVDISRKLMQQSEIVIDSFVQEDLRNALALEIQRVAISGGGTNQPTGILATAGIGDVAGGTNGALPSWQNIVDLETDVSVANADVGTLAYLTNTKVRGRLKTTSKVSGQNGFVWDDGQSPLNGYRCGVTNAVASNLTKGSALGICSAIIFGNFSDLIIGMWGGLDMTVDPYSLSTSGTLRVVVHQDVDVAVRHAESFSAMKDALTA